MFYVYFIPTLFIYVYILNYAQIMYDCKIIFIVYLSINSNIN